MDTQLHSGKQVIPVTVTMGPSKLELGKFCARKTLSDCKNERKPRPGGFPTGAHRAYAYQKASSLSLAKLAIAGILVAGSHRFPARVRCNLLSRSQVGSGARARC